MTNSTWSSESRPRSLENEAVADTFWESTFGKRLTDSSTRSVTSLLFRNEDWAVPTATKNGELKIRPEKRTETRFYKPPCWVVNRRDAGNTAREVEAERRMRREKNDMLRNEFTELRQNRTQSDGANATAFHIGAFGACTFSDDFAARQPCAELYHHVQYVGIEIL